ncbi:MAG: acylneuraminate cytidylyltransferase [uncultured bacterium]|nr:MAG: acylneuraminate cytidylyltransferase [uncultured bacterium]
MKVVAIVQARMGSTRLPGKVMMMLGDKSILTHVITRIRNADLIDDIVIATSTLPQDDVIQKEAKKCNIHCYRGSETDVLTRYYEAAKNHQANVIVRITADCPFLDPFILNDMIIKFKQLLKENKPIDYLSNCLTRSYPRGLDIEIFTIKTLQQTYHQANQDYQREHVTPYIYQNPHLFSLHNYANQLDLSEHRWTLDTKEDFDFISIVYNKLSIKNENFTTNDIISLLQKEPELKSINIHIKQKELIQK